MSTEYFIQPLDHAQGRVDKPYKTTFFQSEHLLVGLNCLLPGQSQHLHDHADQDKFYYVVAGSGLFTVGDQQQRCESATLILAPAGVPHGVDNPGDQLLTFMTVLAPFPS
ncbi:MAG: cupin domain-containing protein [Chloroflexi bacterium]|nr:cupin domain-containing protein [Chloroflexota bacterium]